MSKQSKELKKAYQKVIEDIFDNYDKYSESEMTTIKQELQHLNNLNSIVEKYDKKSKSIFEIIVVGIPIICISNFKLCSTFVDALCILKLNCQPPSIYNSTVLELFGLKSKFTILVGNITTGIFIFGFIVLVALFRFPCKL